MTLKSYIWQSSYINLLPNPTKEQNKLASIKNLVEKFNISCNKAYILASTIFFVLFSIKNFFTKFIKIFIENT